MLKGRPSPTRTLGEETFQRLWSHHYDVIESRGIGNLTSGPFGHFAMSFLPIGNNTTRYLS